MLKKATGVVERQIKKAEDDLLKRKKKLLGLRKKVKPIMVSDYSFSTWNGGQLKLSEMFGDKQELMVIHNMGKQCPYCTLWADGFNGVVGHLEQRVPFVVVSNDDVPTQKEFATSRGWRFRMYSSHGSSFFADMGFASPTGGPQPGVSTFKKDAKGRMYRVASASFGPGDDFCATWPLLDLLPKGQNKWEPNYSYKP